MPALPLDEAGKFVAGAYLVFLGLILVYVAIMAAKLQRISREMSELVELAEQGAAPDREPEPAPPVAGGEAGRAASGTETVGAQGAER